MLLSLFCEVLLQFLTQEAVAINMPISDVAYGQERAKVKERANERVR